MPLDLAGRTIVITGASSGIGAATAIECAKAGMNVVLNGRRADRLGAVATQVRENGGKAAVVIGNVTDDGMSQLLLDQAEHRFGRFWAVFANAGYGLNKPAVEVDDRQLRDIFDVNFFAAMDLLSLAAKRLLQEKRPGHLLMCSSSVAKFTLPGHSAYSATKAAQSHACRAMRIELEPHGIHVSCVHPITTSTEFFEVSARHSGRQAPQGGTPSHAPRLFVQPPERVARAIVRCLRRPQPEVWTSHTVRAVAAVMTFFPWFHDVVMRKTAKADRA